MSGRGKIRGKFPAWTRGNKVSTVLRRSVLAWFGSALSSGAMDKVPRSVESARASAVMRVLGRVERALRTTRYRHDTRVDEKTGRFDWDCSGMASWVLARATPRAHRAVLSRCDHGRPVARDFFEVIRAAPAGKAVAGWSRVGSPSLLLPGDLVAWRRPPTLASKNTGHVMFVERVQSLDASGRRFGVRVIDSTSIPHGSDTRVAGETSGFGHGTITLFTDEPGGEAVAYGWYGLPSRVDFRIPIALGRAVA